MNKIYYAPQAEADIHEIMDYILEESMDASAAERVVDRILDKIDLLKEFSGMGTPLSVVVNVESGYRFLVCGNYIVFYRAEGDCVYIERILHGRRNYMKILFSEFGEE